MFVFIRLLSVDAIYVHHAPKGISSKNDRAKVHSDGPSLVLSWSISQLVNYHVRCVSFRLFIWYLRYGIVGTFGTAVIKFAVLMEPLRESRAPYMVRMRHSATR